MFSGDPWLTGPGEPRTSGEAGFPSWGVGEHVPCLACHSTDDALNMPFLFCSPGGQSQRGSCASLLPVSREQVLDRASARGTAKCHRDCPEGCTCCCSLYQGGARAAREGQGIVLTRHVGAGRRALAWEL